MSKSEVSIAIPDDLVRGIVTAELAKALGNKEELVTAVVRAAIQRKANSYDRTTVFEDEVAKAITEVARAGFQEWLAEHVGMVKAALRRELERNKKRFVDELTKALLDGRFYVKPNITVEIGTAKEF